MTSERVDRQILDDPSGQPEVKQDVDALGSQDRLNEAPQFHYEITIDGRFCATVANGIFLDTMVRESMRNGFTVKIYLREGQPPRPR